MNIKCKCGHEIKAADYNQGRLTKCPKCSDSVALVPEYVSLQQGKIVFRIMAGVVMFGSLLSIESVGPSIAITTGAVSAFMLFTAGELIQVVLDYVGRAR